MQPLIEAKRAELSQLCRAHRVRRLEVFGSALRDDFDPASSDLDFLVEFEPLEPGAYARAFFSLKEALEAMFGRPVDLITAPSVVNPYFRERLATSREAVYAV